MKEGRVDTSRRNVLYSEMRQARQCLACMPISISARLSQLPWLSVWRTSNHSAMRRAPASSKAMYSEAECWVFQLSITGAIMVARLYRVWLILSNGNQSGP